MKYLIVLVILNVFRAAIAYLAWKVISTPLHLPLLTFVDVFAFVWFLDAFCVSQRVVNRVSDNWLGEP